MPQTAEKEDLRILLLEDAPTDAELAEYELRRAGIAYTARRVETRAAFLKALDEFRPDIILSDYKLPDFDGMEALQIMQRDYPDVPVIIVTGALPDVEAVDLIHAGAKDYVLKDRLARLGPAVERALMEARGERARKTAEQALRDSEASLRALVEHSPIAMLVDVGVEADEQITLMNRKFTELFGYTMDDIPDVRHWWPLAYPDKKYREELRVEWIRRVEQAVRNRSDIDPMETTVTCGDGSVRHVRVSLSSIGNKNIITFEDFTERKKAAELIQKNNQLLETVFSSIHVLIAYLDREFNFIKVNTAYAAADQRTPDFYPGKNHFELFPNEENEAIFRKVVETGEPAIYYAKPFEYAGHPERGVSYWDWRLEPIKDAKGKVEGLLFSLLNVTEQTLAVQKIRAVSQYARSLIEASLDPLVTISAEGKITDVNAATEKATGRGRTELVGADFSDYFTEPDQAREGYRQVFQRGFVTDYPLAIRHQDGHVTDVLYNASVYRDETGKVQGVFAAARDVTDRNKAEKEREQYFKFFNTSTDLMGIAEPNGAFKKVNPAFMQVLGYSEAEILAKPFIEFVHPDDRQPTLDEMARQLKLGYSLDFENRYLCKDGSVRWLSWRASVNYAEGLTYATARDITERKKIEMALQRLNRTLRTLSAGNHALVHGENEKGLLESMCRATTESGYLLAWVGYAMQDEGQSVRPMATSGEGAAYVEALDITWADEPRGRGPTGTAIRSGQTQICHDIRSDPRMAPWREAAAKYGFASSIALPLLQDGAAVGSLTIYAAEPYAFDADQVVLLEEMAGDLAFGIANLRTRNERDQAVRERQHYAERLRTSLEDALQAIATTVEMRDPYTAGHQRRVAHLAAAIAREMGLPQEQSHGVHLAGIVHDLGKIHIPAEVLSKPGRLTEIEYSFIKIHPQAGYDILKGIEFPWPIAQAVLQHHERFDGSGYPQSLQGEAIILDARILAVADVVEAMASHRPYRPALGLDAALSEIGAKRGIQFDPAAVDACLRLFAQRNYILPT